MKIIAKERAVLGRYKTSDGFILELDSSGVAEQLSLLESLGIIYRDSEEAMYEVFFYGDYVIIKTQNSLSIPGELVEIT